MWGEAGTANVVANDSMVHSNDEVTLYHGYYIRLGIILYQTRYNIIPD